MGCVPKHVLFLVIAVFELCTPANDGNNPGDLGSRAKMFVRVRKGGFRILGPMFYLRLCNHKYIYIYIYTTINIIINNRIMMMIIIIITAIIIVIYDSDSYYIYNCYLI